MHCRSIHAVDGDRDGDGDGRHCVATAHNQGERFPAFSEFFFPCSRGLSLSHVRAGVRYCAVLMIGGRTCEALELIYIFLRVHVCA